MFAFEVFCFFVRLNKYINLSVLVKLLNICEYVVLELSVDLLNSDYCQNLF